MSEYQKNFKNPEIIQLRQSFVQSMRSLESKGVEIIDFTYTLKELNNAQGSAHKITEIIQSIKPEIQKAILEYSENIGKTSETLNIHPEKTGELLMEELHRVSGAIDETDRETVQKYMHAVEIAEALPTHLDIS